MFPVAVRAADIVKKSNGIIALELPTHCAYWKTYAMRNFIERFQLELVNFNGCSFNLRAKFGPLKGQLISKPWTVATDSGCVVRE